MLKTVTRMGRRAVIAGFFLAAASGYANGYRLLCLKSAKATAMGEAFIVQADDPSAVAFNPAGLAQLDGLQLNLQGTLCNTYTEHRSPAGDTTDNKDKWQWVPALFATQDLGGLGFENATVGLGVSLPNGLSNEWGDDSFARYSSTFSDLVVADFALGLGVQVTDKLSLGAGVNFYYSELRFESMWSPGSMFAVLGVGVASDVENTITGEGTAWGFNLGATYRFNEKHAVAVVYHHPYTIDYEGDFELDGYVDSDMDSSMDFPGVVTVGYAYQATPKLKLEVNVDWTNWERVDDTVDIYVDQLGASLPQSNDLNNTFSLKFGAEYQYTEKLALRAGYIYNENATGEATWRPSLPDTDTHFFTLGFGYTWGNVTIDGAFQVVYYDTRTIDNNVDMNEILTTSSLDGTYRTWCPCFSLGATYRF